MFTKYYGIEDEEEEGPDKFLFELYSSAVICNLQTTLLALGLIKGDHNNES